MIFDNVVMFFAVLVLATLVRADHFIDDTNTTALEYVTRTITSNWVSIDSDSVVSVDLSDGNGTLHAITGSALSIDSDSFLVPSTSWFNSTL